MLIDKALARVFPCEEDTQQVGNEFTICRDACPWSRRNVDVGNLDPNSIGIVEMPCRAMAYCIGVDRALLVWDPLALLDQQD